jgi:hypothetical protein
MFFQLWVAIKMRFKFIALLEAFPACSNRALVLVETALVCRHASNHEVLYEYYFLFRA